MSLHGYNPYERYRSRRHNRLAHAMLFIMIIAVSMGSGYWFGQDNSTYLNSSLQEEVAVLKRQQVQTMEILTELKAKAKTANLRYEQLKTSYSEEMGQGPFPELIALVRTQLDKGVMPERLEMVIRSARPPEKCSKPETGKVIVKTETYNGADSQISVAEGNILISVTGEPAVNENDEPEAWYDPALPVSVSFNISDRGMDVKKGVLPLHHSIILNNKEYRFTFTRGAVSYVDIMYDSCSYP